MIALNALIELLLVWTIGCGVIAATFVVGDVTGDWMSKITRELYDRYRRAQIRMGWQEVAARHRRKVKA